MNEEKQIRKKRRKEGGRLAFVLIVAILLLYLCTKIFDAFFTGIQTVPAEAITVNDSVLADGWFFREETLVPDHAPGAVKHIVFSGERVQQDASLAIAFADEQAQQLSRALDPLDSQISALDAALQSTGASDDAAKLDQLIMQELQLLSAQVEGGSGSALVSSAETLRSLSLRRVSGELNSDAVSAARAALVSERDELNRQLMGRTTQISAPSSGYFSEIIDGYESMMTPSTLKDLTLEQFHELINTPQKKEAQNELGKIIEGFTWYLVAEIPDEQIKRYTKGDNLRVCFTQASLEAPVTVSQIIREHDSETALLVLEGNDFNSEMVSMRRQPVEIISGTYTGLRVPKQAARMVGEGDDTSLGVYILSGSLTREKKIDVLYEAADYYVVRQSATDANALVVQDQIVIRGKGLQDNMVVKT